MLRIDRAMRQQAHHAPVVPGMYPTLAARQVAIRRGEVSMIAGEPGAGKSTLALDLAVRSKAPTLYVSADTHAHTVSLRLLANLSGRDQDSIEPHMSNPQYAEWVKHTIQPASHIRWCFESAPTIQRIEQEIDAFHELYGDTPDMVVVDNLTDVIAEGQDEWGGMRSLLKDMKFLARFHDTALLVLHHTSEGWAMQSGVPHTPPRKALQGKVAQTPALVLTVSNHDPGLLYVTPVKHRYGPADPTGFTPASFVYQPACMRVLDVGERASV